MARVDNIGKETVSNFQPANGSGSAVRTAMKNIFEALRTVNSGDGDPSGDANVAAYQLHINTTNAGASTPESLLKIKHPTDTGFVTLGNVLETNFGFYSASGGVLTGNILGNNNTGASAPSFSFNSDTNTGMYRAASNTIGFSTNGVERALISNNGIDIKDGLALRLQDSSGSAFVAIKAPSSLNADLTLTLPVAAPTAASTVNEWAGYALIAIDESGSLGWGLAGGAEGAAGSNNQVFWENDQAVTDSYTITTGKNAGSFGPITINSGVTVTVGSGQTWTVV